jgi:hypothetical protein
MYVTAWAFFNSPEEKKALYEVVERCNSFVELYLELCKLYPTEETILINILAKRLIKEKK